MEESMLNLHKYVKKLTNIVQNNAIFTFLDKKLIDKRTIDDILCCIESSFPEEYKDYIKKPIGRKSKSYSCYSRLKEKIQKKFFLSSSHYLVYYKEIPSITQALLKTIEADIKFINEPSNMS